jgi:hypothetical protein
MYKQRGFERDLNATTLAPEAHTLLDVNVYGELRERRGDCLNSTSFARRLSGFGVQTLQQTPLPLTLSSDERAVSTHTFIFPLDLCYRDRRKAEIAQTGLLLPFGLSRDRPHPSDSEETVYSYYDPVTQKDSCLTSHCNAQVRRILHAILIDQPP